MKEQWLQNKINRKRLEKRIARAMASQWIRENAVYRRRIPKKLRRQYKRNELQRYGYKRNKNKLLTCKICGRVSTREMFWEFCGWGDCDQTDIEGVVYRVVR